MPDGLSEIVYYTANTLNTFKHVLDPTSLGAAEGGESTGESICIAALVIVDFVVAVAVSPTSELSCIS